MDSSRHDPSVKKRYAPSIWAIIGPNKRWAVATVVLSISSAMAEIAGISLVIPILVEFSGQTVADSAGISGWIVERTSAFAGSLPKLLGALALLFVLRATLFFTALHTSNVLFSLTIRRLQEHFIARYFEADFENTTFHEMGAVSEVVLRRTFQTGAVIKAWLEMFTVGFLALAYLSLMFSVSWLLTLIVLAFGAATFGLSGFIVKLARKLGQRNYESELVISRLIRESLDGMRLIRSYSQEENHLSSFSSAQGELFSRRIRKMALTSLPAPLIELISVSILILMILVAEQVIGAGSTPIIAIMAVMIVRLSPLVAGINTKRAFVASEFYNVESVWDFISQPATPGSQTGTQVFEGKIHRGIEFDDVTFRYSTRNVDAINSASFLIPAQKTTVLMGSSGSGKSTIIDLILGFYRLQSGTIKIDGGDVNDLSSESWRASIGVVSQDGFLFNTTIRENIMFGNPKASEADLVQVSEEVGITQLIKELPMGFDTVIGDHGYALSGGQRQRVTIARALIRRPELLIFDEATSNLDRPTGEQIQASIAGIDSSITKLLITHDSSMLSLADHVVLIDGGQVQFAGSPVEFRDQDEGEYSD